MTDVITIGSATRDVFIQSKEIKAIQDTSFPTGEGLAFSLGSKLPIDELSFTIGGGSINPAATFARQGLKVSPLVVIGKDGRGEEILSFLKEHKIDSSLVFSDSSDITAYSLIISDGKGERTILEYEGVKWNLIDQKIPWTKIKKAKWLYISHLGGRSAKFLPRLMTYAKKNNIKIAWNPGRTQLQDRKTLVPLLKHVDVCSLNQEEASLVSQIPYQQKKKVFKKLDDLVHGIVVMTKGSKGVEVSNGKHIWTAGILEMNDVVDRTGAGDAFGSGFVTSLIRDPDDIEKAIQFASANATGVLTMWGSTNGLLQKGDKAQKWGKLKISKTSL